jgi:hypothetical protein
VELKLVHTIPNHSRHGYSGRKKKFDIKIHGGVGSRAGQMTRVPSRPSFHFRPRGDSVIVAAQLMSESKEKGSCCTSCSCSRKPGGWILLLAVVAVVVAVAAWPRKSKTDNAPTSALPSAAIAASAKAETPDLRFLKGRWVRPDGGYVIEIRQVDDDGQLDARYFNPSPIRVVNSKAEKDGAAVKVYIELDDVNYPGCKYNLTYIPDQRILVGTYFQAAMRQTYDVAFERE